MKPKRYRTKLAEQDDRSDGALYAIWDYHQNASCQFAPPMPYQPATALCERLNHYDDRIAALEQARARLQQIGRGMRQHQHATLYEQQAADQKAQDFNQWWRVNGDEKLKPYAWLFKHCWDEAYRSATQEQVT